MSVLWSDYLRGFSWCRRRPYTTDVYYRWCYYMVCLSATSIGDGYIRMTVNLYGVPILGSVNYRWCLYKVSIIEAVYYRGAILIGVYIRDLLY